MTTCDAHTAPGATSGAHGHPEVVDALALLDRSVKTARADVLAALAAGNADHGEGTDNLREIVREIANDVSRLGHQIGDGHAAMRENFSAGHDARRDFHGETLTSVELVAEGVAKVGRQVSDGYAALTESITLGNAARREDDEQARAVAEAIVTALNGLDAEMRRRLSEGARTLKTIEQAAAGLTTSAAESQATVTRMAGVVQQIAAGVERIAAALAEHHEHGAGTPEALAAHTEAIHQLERAADQAAGVAASSAAAIDRQGKALDELTRGRAADSTTLTGIGDRLDRHARRLGEAVEAVGGKLDMHHVHTAGVPEAMTTHAAAIAELKALIGTAAGVTTSTHQIAARSATALDGLVLGRAQDAQMFGTFGQVLDRHTRQLADAEGAHNSHTAMLRRIGDRLAITSGQHSGPAAAEAAAAGARHEPDHAEQH